MFSRWEKGIVHLGIIGLVVLTAGLFAASKLASNPDLTFFNLGEYAKVSEEDECGGCVDGYRLKWNKQKNRCIKTLSPSCVVKPKPTSRPSPIGIGENECAICNSDSDCLEGLVCLRQATCAGIDCSPVASSGACVRSNGSSNCPNPYPTPKITTPSPFPKPKPSSGVCSCFGGTYQICDQSQDGETDSIFRCQNGCAVSNGIGTCVGGVDKGEYKSGELCYDDFMCQSGKCITPVIGPFKFNPPTGFSKVCY